MRVLIVDDDAVNRRLIGAMLEMGGVDVAAAASAREAFIALDGPQEFAAILMDPRMPDTDGLTATRRIRSRDDDRARLPIAIVTADAALDLWEQCEAAGADLLIRKPLHMGGVHDALGKLLAIRKPPGGMVFN